MSRVKQAAVDLLQTRIGSQLLLRPVVTAGHRWYHRTGTTPPMAYAAMRKLFGSPAAHVLDDLAARDRERGGTIAVGAVGVVAGEHDDALANLRRHGIHVFRTPLPEAMCAALEALATCTPATLVAALPGAPARARFDPAAPLAARYDIDEDDLLADSVVQDLLADESLLRLAQAHLGTTPVQDLVAMWWSAPVGAAPSSAAAQRFHFDLDRLRFLKLFVYLTDVDDGSGPHVFVRGTHRDLPRALRADRRFDDVEVETTFGAGAPATIVGRRGTMFVADTRGLHKGLPARERHRLVFQLEWATSLFGHPVPARRLPLRSERLRRALAQHPAVYRRFATTP